MFRTILLILVVLALLGALPIWPYSRSWGFAPTTGLSVVLLLIIVALLAGVF